MVTVKDYYTRQIIGTYKSHKLAYKAISALGMMVHHVVGKTVIAIR